MAIFGDFKAGLNLGGNPNDQGRCRGHSDLTKGITFGSPGFRIDQVIQASGDEENSLDPNFIKAQREGERRDALDCPPKSRLDRFAFGFEIPVVGNDNSGAASMIDE